MKITKDEVKHISRLSRLHLSGEEIETFGSQLNTIIDYIEQLNAVNTRNVEPTFHVIPLKNVMRGDILTQSLPAEDALKNAPDAAGKFYRVPKIIE